MHVTSRTSEPVTFYWQGAHFHGHFERHGRRRYLMTGVAVQLPLDGTPITVRFVRRPDETIQVVLLAVANHVGQGIARLRVRVPGKRIQSGAEQGRVWGRREKGWPRAS